MITWIGLIRNGLDYLFSEGASNRRTNRAYEALDDPEVDGLLDTTNVMSSQMKQHGQFPTLDKIDKVFACNVGDYIDLPQIVVAGDQSSGKSSVLVGLTDLPFERDSGLCIRFVTQITFRRSAARRITVSIVPVKDSGTEHAGQVCPWARDMETLDQKSFADIMREV
jgi:hypothetical protein